MGRRINLILPNHALQPTPSPLRGSGAAELHRYMVSPEGDKSDNYDRNVSLHCPTCGSTQFEYDETLDDDHAEVRCISCDREMTKDELIHENSENINEHVFEIGKQAVDDVAKEMRKSLKKAFNGNKNIKFK